MRDKEAAESEVARHSIRDEDGTHDLTVYVDRVHYGPNADSLSVRFCGGTLNLGLECMPTNEVRKLGLFLIRCVAGSEAEIGEDEMPGLGPLDVLIAHAELAIASLDSGPASNGLQAGITECAEDLRIAVEEARARAKAGA